MRVYVVVAISSGEVPAGFDQLQVFGHKQDALKALKKDHDQLIEEIEDYGEITEDDYGEEYYTVVLEEEDCTTTYEGRVFLKEVK